MFSRHRGCMLNHSGPTAASAFPSSRSRDIAWFCWMGAGRTDRPLRLSLAIAIAHWSWLPLVVVLASSMVFRADAIGPVLSALGVATLMQWLVKRLARWLSSRRPFAIGLCANHLHHSDRGGMPSTHASVMACLAGALSPWMVLWPEFALMPSIAVITAWARVQAGAHFPSDALVGLMLGASVGSAAARAFSWS